MNFVIAKSFNLLFFNMRTSRIILFAVFFAILSLGASAQDDNKEAAKQIVEIANEAYFNLRVILVANEQYVQAADLDPENLEANYMAGRTYLETNYKSRATKYLLRVFDIDPNYKFNILYMIGQSYQYGLQFQKAIDYYNRYLDKLKGNPSYHGDDFTVAKDVDRRVYECGNGIEFVATPMDYVIENVGPAINSEWDDFAPVLNADETFMVFTTRRQEGNTNENVFDDNLYYEDIFESHRVDGKWQTAKNIGPPINSPYHDSNVAINADGTQLYLYKSQNGGDIYLSEKKADGNWSDPVPLNENINSTYSENSVSISPDGTTLFFSSDRPITPGKTDLDIYYSKLDRKGGWGQAKNIGSVINTEYDEDGPFIDYDGKTLYFSSKGHKGMGGYDIYKSVYDSATQQWSQPVNLGYPMNSPDNDVYFVSTRDGKRGYYASAREDGMGFTDIYQIRLADLKSPSQLTAKKEEKEEEKPKEIEKPQLQPITLLLKAVDAQTNNEIDVDVNVFNTATNQPVNISQVSTGLYSMTFNNSEQTLYNLSVEKSGYMFKNLTISIPASTIQAQELKRKVSMERIQEGYSAVLRNIYFDFDRATIKPESYPELNKLKKILTENPNTTIEISGHTDNVGPKDFNKELSQNRANAVVHWLITQGIGKNRLIARGYGEERPLASNDDEREGRELNRRVEFKVLKATAQNQAQ